MQGIDDRVVVSVFLDSDKDSIVTRYRPHDFRDVAVVDIISYAAGVARPRMDNADIAGEMYVLKTRHGHHLHCLERCMNAVIHRLIGQHIDIVTVNARRLSHLELLEIAAQRSLCHWETLALKLLHQIFLTVDFLARKNHLDGIQPLTFNLHRIVYCVLCIFILFMCAKLAYSFGLCKQIYNYLANKSNGIKVSEYNRNKYAIINLRA